MICDKCGAKNSEKRYICFNCGSTLPKCERIAESVYIQTPAENTDDYGATKNEVSENKPVNNTDNTGIPDYYTFQPADEYYEDEATDGADDSENADEYRDDRYKEDDGYEEDDDYNVYDENGKAVDDDELDDIIIKPGKKSFGITIAIWLLTVLFVSTLTIAGIMLYMYITENDNTAVAPSKTSISNLDIAAPTVTKERDENDNEYLHVVFYGEPGDRIFLACNNSTTTFIEETLEMDLYLKDLFSSEYEFKESTVMANMNAYLVRNNTKYACNVPAYSLSVPVAETEMIAPTSTTQKIYSDKYNVKLWTSTDSKITLNNTDITGYMDGLGTVTYPIDVKENTNTTYQLEVIQPYHTPKSIVFILSRDALPVTLTIATSNASVISDSTITISGSTEPNVEITSNLPILDLQINTLYNTYNAMLDLSGMQYGQIEATITATDSKGSSTLSHTFWYWPDENKVTTSSGKLTTAVISDCSNYKGQNIVMAKATAVKIVSSELFEATVNISGTDYSVLVSNEYEKSANVKVGSQYKIFARCEGYEQDGLPVFKGWFIYKAD